ncbi:MAG TPA: ChaN family lipoprotein [Kofleriaceae bacterium]|nr:ChaN family lipoprotein [Kofleriaceae bacterium]
MLARCAPLVFLIACVSSGAKGPAKPQSPAQSRGIEGAALPYSILDARTGHQIDTETFWSQLDAQKVVCVGEDHPNPHHHWVQLEVMSKLADQVKDRKLGLGMEMFQRPVQGILDDFVAKRIDEPTLLSRSAWEDRWGYDYGFYGPTIRRAVLAGAALVALNAPRELTRKIAHQGMSSLSTEEKAQLPQLDLDNKTHRAWWDDLMSGMDEGGHAHGQAHAQGGDEEKQPEMPTADNVYTAQVVWDETMADSAVKWLQATPTGLMVVLAGNGHCHDSAIVGRIKRRGVNEVVSVRPVLDTEGNVAEALAKPQNDYLVVLKLPPSK